MAKLTVGVSFPNIRITRDKPYYVRQCEIFAQRFAGKGIKCVDFGKQDIRGGVSITLHDHNYCVPAQEFFASKDEMLGFVVGTNQAIDWEFSLVNRDYSKN